MKDEIEAILDRRRLRRRVSLWRILAVLAFAVLAAVLFSRVDVGKVTGGKQIARVEISGLITDDRKLVELLDKIAKDSSVSALVLDVNSPGGTTTGGEALYAAIRNVAEKKPVTAVFGTVATSAAYIVGIASDHIVSRGNSITGSVGVIVQWAEVSGLLEKVGVRMNEIKSGPLKANPSMFAPLDDAGRQRIQSMIEDSQKWFNGLVAERRKINLAAVPGLLDGAVYSGRQALTHKLVDEIGDEKVAVSWLENERGVEKGLNVVDWKVNKENYLGVLGRIGWVADRLTGGVGGALFGSILGAATGDSIPLDGLVSLWHPAANS